VSIKVIAIIKKESSVDPRTHSKCFHAALSLLNEDGIDYGTPRYFGTFEDVAQLLKREAGATHEQLHDRYPRYQRGEDVRLSLTLDNDEAIKNLGFNPKGI
jgi:nucleoside-diphosphate-sugar epimerase